MRLKAIHDEVNLMKRTVISLLLAILCLTACLPAVALSAQDIPETLFETVKWSVDFPKTPR